MMIIRRIEGTSMFPTYRPGAIVIGWKYKRPQLGDIVIAQLPGREIIKRVEAVSEKGYFLRGDNREASTDSRTYGWFTHRAIKGVVARGIAR